MDERELLIYGGGGHGLVVAESAEAAGWAVRGFVDDRLRPGTPLGKWKVVGHGNGDAAGISELAERMGRLGHMIVALGDNAVRWHLMNELRAAGVALATVVDPTARVSESASVEPGAYVGAGAVVNAEAAVGPGCIVNSAAVVEHHAVLGAAVHVAPAAVMTGRTQAGDRAMIGANATVLPRLAVGEEAVVGAGAVVTRDVAARTTVIGCPARVA